MLYKKANIIKAIFCYLFDRPRYISMAVAHNMAINLEARDLRKLYEEGKYPTEESLKEMESSIINFANLLQEKIVKSLFLVTFLLALMLVAGYFTDAIHPSLSFDTKYVLSVLGALLLVWSSLISLGPELGTYKGKALHEVFFVVFRTALLISGTLCLVLVFAF